MDGVAKTIGLAWMTACLSVVAMALVARLAHSEGMDGRRVVYMVALAVTLSINGWLLGWYDSGR